MAFPAYSTEIESKAEELENEDWLKCSSFIPISDNPPTQKKKKKKSRKRSKCSSVAKDDSQLFSIESEPVPQVLCSKPADTANSKCEEKKGNDKSKRKKKKRTKEPKKNRYFAEGFPEESDHTKMDPEEYFKRTKELNVLLREHPRDVDSWCQYLELQDKGEGTRSGIASKKLSIVDKALESNPSSDVLLSKKLALMEETMPYDKVVSEAKILASKHMSSKIGWRWLISSTQFNLTRLTAPGLINHFAAMLEDATKRGGQPKFILDVFLEVGMFLRQAGLWELMWTLIEQYLEICYTVIGSEAFKIASELPQKEIDSIEDNIMTSGLPLHALWMRTEHLRSCVHFLPTLDDSGDHQRLILPEDVAPLLYPISTDLSSRLAGVALTLLKIPPLPCTEAFVNFLGLDNIPWHLESSEILLSAMLSPGVSRVDDSYLNELKELLVPPQYINEKLGSDCFFDAVSKMFHLIADHSTTDKINFLVWLIRWYRFCVKTKSISGTQAKPLLTVTKNILKKHRTALPIYTEYALLEEQAGNVASSLKVLETAINLQDPGLLASKRDQRCIFAAYRAYAEVLLRNNLPDHKDRLFKLFIAMAFGEKVEKVHQVKPDLISKALERFDHVSAELFTDGEPEDPSLDDIIVGSADIHWLACHAWFSFIQRGTLPRFLQSDDDTSTKSPIFAEALLQLKIDVLGLMKQTGSSAFSHKGFTDEVVNACTRYPNNTFFLHTLSSLKFDGVRWGKISSSLVQTGSQIAVMFSALLSKNRYFSEGVQQSGAITKMYSVLKKCSESKPLERCPMLWRLILQYVSTTHNEDIVEKEYHKAVEKCPWVKILYYEAAVQLPKLLADIQDLLTEKELRIHVTPEELEILRESAPPDDPKETSDKSVNIEKAVASKSEGEEPSSASDAVAAGLGEVCSSIREESCDPSSSSGSDTSEDDTHSSTKMQNREIPHQDKYGYAKTDRMNTSSSDDSSYDEDDDGHEIAASNSNTARIGENDVHGGPSRAERSSGQNLHSLQGTMMRTRWDSDECLADQAGGAQSVLSPEPDANPDETRKWDEEKLRIAKRLWEDRQRAKRKMEEVSGTDYYDPAAPNSDSDEDLDDRLKKSRPNDMSRLEELERARILPDTCQDELSVTEYEKTEWTKDRLKSVREMWEARKNK